MHKVPAALILLIFALASPSFAALQQIGFAGEFPFEDASAIAADEEGRLYVAGKGAVAVLDGSGKTLLTLSGKSKDGSYKLTEPSALALYGGNIYVLDKSERRLLIFSKDGSYVDSFGEGGDRPKQFSDPSGVCVFGGLIYVADTGNKRIQVFGPDGVYMRTITGPPEKPFERPSDLAVNSSGNIHVLDTKLKAVRVFDSSGRFLREITGFGEPASMSMEADNVYVADNADYKIKKYGPDGAFLFSFGVEGKGRGQFRRLSAIAASGGKLYAADSKKDTIQVFTPEKPDAAASESAPPPTSVKWLGEVKLQNAGRLFPDGKDRLYVIDAEQEAIVVLKGSSVEKTIKIKKVNPAAVAKGKDGSLWVADSKGDRIIKINENGEILLSAGSGGKKEGYLSDPADIAVSKGGFIYVADKGNKRVQIFNSDGMFVSVVGRQGDSSSIERPIALAFDGLDNLYVLEEEKSTVVKFSPEGKLLSSFGKKGSGKGEFQKPVALSLANNEVFVLDAELRRVLVFSAEGSLLREFGSEGKGKGDFKKPSAIAVRGGTEVIVSDAGNARIQSMGILYTPAVPSKPAASGSMRKIRLKWEAGEEFIEKYTVFRSLKSTGGFVAVAAVAGTFYEDSAVEPDTPYFYRISASAKDGNESLMSVVSDAKAQKYATSPPKGLEANPADRDVTLAWKPNAEGFLSHYAVYRETQGDFKLIGKTDAPTFFDKTVRPNTAYTYRVSALSSDGVESAFAEIKVGTLKETKSPLEISVVEMKGIFSNIYKLYETEGLGKLRVTNNTWDTIARLKLSFTIKEYMDFATELNIENIEPRQSMEVIVKPVFNNRILSVTENTPVQMEVKATYFENQQQRSYADNYTLQLYEKHYLTWEVREWIGTFITPKDAPVLEFSREIARQYRDMPEPLIYARGVYDALGLIGMAYLPDPTNPYQVTSEKTDLVDYVQYPQETLKRKSGDCDDLVNLYSASLESLGIRTLLLDTPGHIFMMFSTGIKASELEADEMFVARDGLLWVPVEVTMVGSSFLKAWKKGIENYRQWDGKGLVVVDLRTAWEKFKPASLPATDWRAEHVKRQDIEAKHSDELDYLRKLRIRHLSKQHLAALDKDPKNASARLKLGIIYGESGEPAEAMKRFNEVVSAEPKNAAAKNNIGNVHFIQGRFEDARKAYEDASALDSSDAHILVNLSRCYLKLGMKEQAKAAYDKAAGQSPEIVNRYIGLTLEIEKARSL